MPSTVSSHALYYYLTVFTLLDQLNPKQFYWRQLSVILQHQLPFDFLDKLVDLLDGTKFNIEFIRIASKFFMNRDRAGSLWVNPRRYYAGLVTYVLDILCDK